MRLFAVVCAKRVCAQGCQAANPSASVQSRFGVYIASVCIAVQTRRQRGAAEKINHSTPESTKTTTTDQLPFLRGQTPITQAFPRCSSRLAANLVAVGERYNYSRYTRETGQLVKCAEKCRACAYVSGVRCREYRTT